MLQKFRPRVFKLGPQWEAQGSAWVSTENVLENNKITL